MQRFSGVCLKKRSVFPVAGVYVSAEQSFRACSTALCLKHTLASGRCGRSIAWILKAFCLVPVGRGGACAAVRRGKSPVELR